MSANTSDNRTMLSTSDAAGHAGLAAPLALLARGNALAARFAGPDLAGLALRFALAIPFWRSGLTKWDGFLQLSNGARFLFESEFKLHILGNQYPYPAPILMAFLSGVAEIILPVLLVLGLFTRYAALGLLAMTAVIQLTVPGGWAQFHLPWAAMALAILFIGPGRLSADQLLFTNSK